ncbi:hypothetical protein JQ582_40810 [Bradyrhizobium japonicum]|nr:hypothetical protein [Bradyrhizobium japonicum]
MTSRQQRRADTASLRKLRSNVVVTHLIGAGDRRLARAPSLRDAIRNFHYTAPTRGPICICCRTKFGSTVRPAAFLLGVSGGVVSTSGVCNRCWRSAPDAEIEAAALRTLRKLIGSPGAHFEDAAS